MHYDTALDTFCDDISIVLLDVPEPSARAVAAATHATRCLAAALRLSAGSAHDPLWFNALASLSRFLDLARESTTASDSRAFRALHGFLDENADVFAAQPHLERAS